MGPLAMMLRGVLALQVVLAAGTAVGVDVADLELILEANAVTGSSGDPVATWSDSGPNGRHATQSTSALQPILRTNVLNNHSVIEFGTTGHTLLTLPATSSMFFTGTGLTMYAVLMSNVSVSAGLSFVADYGLYPSLGTGFAWDATQIKYLYTSTSASPAGRQSDMILHNVASGSFAVATVHVEFAPSGRDSYTDIGSDVCVNPALSGGAEAFISGWGVSGGTLTECQASCRAEPNCIYLSHSTTGPEDYCMLYNANAYPCAARQGDSWGYKFTTYVEDSKVGFQTVRVNGVQVQSDHILLTQLGDAEIAQPSGSTSSSTEGLFTIGAQAVTGSQSSRYFNGQLAELRVYGTNHSHDILEEVELSLKLKYAVGESSASQPHSMSQIVSRTVTAALHLCFATHFTRSHNFASRNAVYDRAICSAANAQLYK